MSTVEKNVFVPVSGISLLDAEGNQDDNYVDNPEQDNSNPHEGIVSVIVFIQFLFVSHVNGGSHGENGKDSEE